MVAFSDWSENDQYSTNLLIFFIRENQGIYVQIQHLFAALRKQIGYSESYHNQPLFFAVMP